jgi:hypothetical protein
VGKDGGGMPSAPDHLHPRNPERSPPERTRSNASTHHMIPRITTLYEPTRSINRHSRTFHLMDTSALTQFSISVRSAKSALDAALRHVEQLDQLEPTGIFSSGRTETPSGSARESERIRALECELKECRLRLYTQGLELGEANSKLEDMEDLRRKYERDFEIRVAEVSERTRIYALYAGRLMDYIRTMHGTDGGDASWPLDSRSKLGTITWNLEDSRAPGEDDTAYHDRLFIECESTKVYSHPTIEIELCTTRRDAAMAAFEKATGYEYVDPRTSTKRSHEPSTGETSAGIPTGASVESYVKDATDEADEKRMPKRMCAGLPTDANVEPHDKDAMETGDFLPTTSSLSDDQSRVPGQSRQ